jgi:hypothetical protein
MRYEKDPRISYKIIDNEVFVMNRANGVINSFNATGSFLFSLIGNNAPFDSLVSSLSAEYEIPQNDAAVDVAAFLKELGAKGLVRLYDE